MTPTPHLHALAMRTKAAELCANATWFVMIGEKALRGRKPEEYAAAILALPIEADHADLLREAVKLPEIAALIEAASEQAGYMSLLGDDGDLLRNLVNALQPFLALETP